MYGVWKLLWKRSNRKLLLLTIGQRCEDKFQGLNMVWDYKIHSNLIEIPDGSVSKKLAKIVNKVEVLCPQDIDEKKIQQQIEGIMDGDDAGAGEIILKHYPHWKCCNAILYVFDNLTGMWSDKVDVHNRIISHLIKICVYDIRKKYDF